jgi:ElaB/YqjD/DUF883 family membrane-anchored ribosome-binding protein
MTDTTFKTARGSAAQDLGDTLQKTGEAMKDKASETLSATSDMAREKLDELGSVARDAADKAADKIKEQVGQQQHAGADYAHRFAENLRNAAHAFDAETPIAARAIEAAAGYIDDAADKVRDGSFSELMDNVTAFARRQPAAFLGLSVLAGFAAVRFLKAAGNPSRRDSTNYRNAKQAPGTTSGGTSTGYSAGMQASSGGSEWQDRQGRS